MLHSIRSFLSDSLRLLEALRLSGGRIKETMAEASRLGSQILEAGPADKRGFLLDVVSLIEIGRDRIRIVLRANVLSAMLVLDEAGRERETGGAMADDEIRLDLPIRFKRRGVEMKLIVIDHREQPPAPDKHLIAAVAQGRDWFARIRDGDTQSVRHLSEQLSINQGDVSRILPLGLLAPDIVEAILDGRQPVELTASRLKRLPELPISWAEQRRLLGFA